MNTSVFSHFRSNSPTSVVDDIFLTDDPLRLIAALKPRPADQTPLTLLIGDVANEGTMFINGLQVCCGLCVGASKMCLLGFDEGDGDMDPRVELRESVRLRKR